ncbi:MAG: hypothetical protein ACRD1H_02940, partial [Vicinamibacterales bacterium]
RLERLLESDNPWLWFFVLLLPTGDLPYFVAGLSRISMRHYFSALFAARMPLTFILTHAAARATTLPSETLLGLTLLAAVIGALVYWKRERISQWIHESLDRFASPPRSPHET